MRLMSNSSLERSITRWGQGWQGMERDEMDEDWDESDLDAIYWNRKLFIRQMGLGFEAVQEKER